MFLSRVATRSVRPALAAKAARRPVVTKTTTGLVGLKVDPEGRVNLIALNEELLEAVKEARRRRPLLRRRPGATPRPRADPGAQRVQEKHRGDRGVPHQGRVGDGGRASPGARGARARPDAAPAQEEAIEEEIGMGQLEELIESQQEEMGVLKMYIEHKMWEHIDELATEFKG